MSLNRQEYQAFAQLLKELRDYGESKQLDAIELQKRVAFLQEFFLLQIVPLAIKQLHEQSYRTEISKQLRLLSLDAMFLQGARIASTTESRLNAIGFRLTTLLQYCNAILELKNEQS